MSLGLLFDTEIMGAKKIDFDEENSLNCMYENIECDTVDVVRLPERIDAWVDDEGLLKSGNPVTLFSIEEENEMQIAGNVLFLSYDNKGKSIGLNQVQVEWLQNNLRVMPVGNVK